MAGIRLEPWRPGPGRVPPGTRVYAVGDIHGRADLLGRILDAVRAEAAAAPGLRHILVPLGDYVDRGPDSAQVVACLADLDLPGVEVRCLRGNHEDFLLEFLVSPLTALAWLVNGGARTLESYGVEAPELLDFPAVTESASRLGAVLPAHHRDFLARLPASLRIGDYLFVHAGIRPGVALDRQSAKDMLWIGDAFVRSEADHGAVIVHGHTISPEVAFRPNRIGIDTGAFASDRLTCLMIEADHVCVMATDPQSEA